MLNGAVSEQAARKPQSDAEECKLCQEQALLPLTCGCDLQSQTLSIQHSSWTSGNFGNFSCKSPRWPHLLNDFGYSTKGQSWVLYGIHKPNMHQNHYLNIFLITFYVETAISFILFTSILLNSLMPVDCYRNQYLIVCSIMHPFHKLSSRELPAMSI